MYKQNTHGLTNLLVIGLLQAVIAKMDGYRNPTMAPKVFNFFRVLESSNRKAFDFVSANLAGPAIRSMQRRNVLERGKPFIDYNVDSIKTKVLSIINKRTISEGDHLSLSVSIDGTKNSKRVTISTSHQCLFGGPFPHHIIPL